MRNTSKISNTMIKLDRAKNFIRYTNQDSGASGLLFYGFKSSIKKDHEKCR